MLADDAESDSGASDGLPFQAACRANCCDGSAPSPDQRLRRSRRRLTEERRIAVVVVGRRCAVRALHACIRSAIHTSRAMHELSQPLPVIDWASRRVWRHCPGSQTVTATDLDFADACPHRRTKCRLDGAVVGALGAPSVRSNIVCCSIASRWGASARYAVASLSSSHRARSARCERHVPLSPTTHTF